MPLTATGMSRLLRTIDELGPGNTLLYAIHRGLQRLSPRLALERLYVVAQPVRGHDGLAAGRGRNIGVRRLLPGDPALSAFTRIADEMADRHRQGAVCLGAFRGEALLGWLWYTRGTFQDYGYPLDFVLRPATGTAWDFDVYIRPEARLSAAFARLWDSAFARMREAGIHTTLSAISAYNAASLHAHRRLGIRPLGSLLVLRLGRLQAVWAPDMGRWLQCSLQPGFRARLVVDAAPPGTGDQA